jgi:hypothetical protein
MNEQTSQKEVADKRERSRLRKRGYRTNPGVKERESRARKRLQQDDERRKAFNKRRVLNYEMNNTNMHPLLLSLKNAERHLITASQSYSAACAERDAALYRPLIGARTVVRTVFPTAHSLIRQQAIIANNIRS